MSAHSGSLSWQSCPREEEGAVRVRLWRGFPSWSGAGDGTSAQTPALAVE